MPVLLLSDHKSHSIGTFCIDNWLDVVRVWTASRLWTIGRPSAAKYSSDLFVHGGQPCSDKPIFLGDLWAFFMIYLQLTRLLLRGTTSDEMCRGTIQETDPLVITFNRGLVNLGLASVIIAPRLSGCSHLWPRSWRISTDRSNNHPICNGICKWIDLALL